MTWRPTTTLGRWALGLALANLALMLSWRVVPFGAGFGLLAGFAGGVVAIVAIARRHERAALVFAALLPFVLAITFLVAELAIGHG